MDPEKKLTLFLVAFALAIAAVAARSFMSRHKTDSNAIVAPAPKPEATALPTPFPTPIAAFTPTPSPFPVTVEVPPPPKNMGASPPGADPKKANEMMMEMMKKTNLPREFTEKSQQSRQAIARAFNSEADARAALKELQTCLTQPNIAPAGLSLPPETAAQMRQAQAQAKASCSSTANEIGRRFPSLQGEISKIVTAKEPR